MYLGESDEHAQAYDGSLHADYFIGFTSRPVLHFYTEGKIDISRWEVKEIVVITPEGELVPDVLAFGGDRSSTPVFELENLDLPQTFDVRIRLKIIGTASRTAIITDFEEQQGESVHSGNETLSFRGVSNKPDNLKKYNVETEQTTSVLRGNVSSTNASVLAFNPSDRLIRHKINSTWDTDQGERRAWKYEEKPTYVKIRLKGDKTIETEKTLVFKNVFCRDRKQK
jgi:hypothetical protein